MKIKTICLSVILISLLLASSVFSLEYTFHPRISGALEYTDNRDLTKNDKQDDYITIISAGFTAQMLSKTSGLEVSYDPSYSIYYNSSDDNQLRHDANLLAWTAPSKNTRFQLSNNFFLTEDPQKREDIIVVTEEGVVEETGDTTIRRGRRAYYRNTTDANFGYHFGENDLFKAGFGYSLLRNNDSSQTQDNDRYSPYIGLDYWFVPKFGIMSKASYTRGTFDQDSDFVGIPTTDFENYAGTIRFMGRTGTRFSVFAQHDQIYREYDNDDFGNNDYLLYAPSAGFTYVIERGLNLRLGAGYFYQEVDNDKDEQGFFGNSQIDKTWSYRRGSLWLAGLTGLEQNDFGAQNVGLERFAAIQGTAKYLFARSITGDINGLYRYSDVVGRADQDGNTGIGEKVQRFRFGGGLTFNPLKWMAIQLSYNFNKVKSENVSDEYVEHSGLFKITLTPDKPYRHID